MKITDVITENENEKWWLNTTVKPVTPSPHYGPDAGASEFLEIYNILIDGKLWKKNGLPVEFDSLDAARRAVDSIITRYGKPAQVVSA